MGSATRKCSGNYPCTSTHRLHVDPSEKEQGPITSDNVLRFVENKCKFVTAERIVFISCEVRVGSQEDTCVAPKWDYSRAPSAVLQLTCASKFRHMRRWTVAAVNRCYDGRLAVQWENRPLADTIEKQQKTAAVKGVRNVYPRVARVAGGNRPHVLDV